MIKVEHLQKSFRKAIKQPGLVGATRSLFAPQIEIFAAVKDLTFDIPDGAGKSTTIKKMQVLS